MEEPTENQYLSQIEQEMKLKDNKINELSGFASSNIFAQSQDTNLIQWQLELDNILERIEHLLKGDIVKQDEEGNYFYTAPEDTRLIILNDYGVQLLMKTISFYLNRNTILSHYKSERIYEMLADFGDELSDVIYINYVEMGMDSMEKKSRAELLVINILHTIESCFNRSLFGGERDSLRSARVVTQSQPIGVVSPHPQKASGGFLNYKNWGS